MTRCASLRLSSRLYKSKRCNISVISGSLVVSPGTRVVSPGTPVVSPGTPLVSPGTPVSSTNKTDHHDIAEILLKVALNTHNRGSY